MKQFTAFVNGKSVILPFIETTFGKMPVVMSEETHQYEPFAGRDYIAAGVEVSPCGNYFYPALRMYLKGRENAMPEQLLLDGTAYNVFDYHTEWPYMLGENGLLMVKKQTPALALFGVHPKEVLPPETIKRLNLPEIRQRGRAVTFFHIGTLQFGVMFENDLLAQYDKAAAFNHQNAALFYAKTPDYEFWTYGKDTPAVYYDDELKCETKPPFINITQQYRPHPVAKDTLDRFWDDLEQFRLPEMALQKGVDTILLKAAKQGFDLRDYRVAAKFMPPFGTKEGIYAEKSADLSDTELLNALPAHLKKLLRQETPAAFQYLFT